VGDSGGGFALKRRGKRWFLRGVVSYGDAVSFTNQWGLESKSCNDKIPSFYVDLAGYMDWIVQNVNFAP